MLELTDKTLLRNQNYINGAWVDADNGSTVAVTNLATGKLIIDIRNMGAIYTDQDVVVDADLVTARTGGHCHQFARKIIDLLYEKEGGR